MVFNVSLGLGRRPLPLLVGLQARPHIEDVTDLRGSPLDSIEDVLRRPQGAGRDAVSIVAPARTLHFEGDGRAKFQSRAGDDYFDVRAGRLTADHEDRRLHRHLVEHGVRQIDNCGEPVNVSLTEQLSTLDGEPRVGDNEARRSALCEQLEKKLHEQ